MQRKRKRPRLADGRLDCDATTAAADDHIAGPAARLDIALGGRPRSVVVTINSAAMSVELCVLSLVKGGRQHEFGGGWRELVRREANR